MYEAKDEHLVCYSLLYMNCKIQTFMSFHTFESRVPINGLTWFTVKLAEIIIRQIVHDFRFETWLMKEMP
jgi:hypothetical protein